SNVSTTPAQRKGTTRVNNKIYNHASATFLDGPFSLRATCFGIVSPTRNSTIVMPNIVKASAASTLLRQCPIPTVIEMAKIVFAITMIAFVKGSFLQIQLGVAEDFRDERIVMCSPILARSMRLV